MTEYVNTPNNPIYRKDEEELEDEFDEMLNEADIYNDELKLKEFDKQNITKT